MRLAAARNSGGSIGPEDLTRWIGKCDLVGLVLGAVAEVDPGRLVALHGARSPLPPKAMLALLTYCYATGLHASDAIEAATHEDAWIRYLCTKAHPTSGEIQRFRRHHRALLREVLVAVVERVWRFRVPRLSSWRLPAAGIPNAIDGRVGAGALTGWEQVVEGWINRAVLLDSVARDI